MIQAIQFFIIIARFGTEYLKKIFLAIQKRIVHKMTICVLLLQCFSSARFMQFQRYEVIFFCEYYYFKEVILSKRSESQINDVVVHKTPTYFRAMNSLKHKIFHMIHLCVRITKVDFKIISQSILVLIKCVFPLQNQNSCLLC